MRENIQVIVGKGRSKTPYAIRIAGVYVFTNLRTGDQLVGSSINLVVRLISYISPKNIAEGVRLVFRDFRKFCVADYKL